MGHLNFINRFEYQLKYFLLICVLVFLNMNIPLRAQWATQSPVPTYLRIGGVAAPTENHIFIATADDPFDNGGALFESTDGGVNWNQRNIPVNLNSGFNGIFFVDSLYGWLFGNINYRTTDGGNTWNEMPFLGSAYFMKFYSRNFGLTTGNFGKYISTDSGISWVTSPNQMFSFDFLTDLIGLGVSESGIYRTADGGLTFSVVYSGIAKSVLFLSDSIAIGIADSNFVRSTDGGLTWLVSGSANGKTNLDRISQNVAIAWNLGNFNPNNDNRLFRTNDAGISWTDLGIVMPNGAISFVAQDTQTVSGVDFYGNIFYSSDAGQTWNQTLDSPLLPPYSLGNPQPVFPTDQTGYFGYGSGYILKTTDGGASWLQISSGSAETMNDMDRFDDGRLIVVGEDGTVMTNESGTSRWILQEPLTTNDLEAVDVIGAQEVVALDRTGIIYKSSDGGVTWVTGTQIQLNLAALDLHFNSLSEGWVIGAGYSGAALFHTTDGGNTWTPITDFQGSYFALDFEGSYGWAANTNGTYYKTSDDGLTWQQGQLPGSSLSIQDMEFFGSDTGYAVGASAYVNGYVAKSVDGGNNWQTLRMPNSTDTYKDIYLVSANEIWISGSEGNAYFSSDGGRSWSVMNAGNPNFGSFATIAATPSGDAWMAGTQGYIRYFSGPPPPPLNWPPVAAFDFIATGFQVDFIDLSTDVDGTIVSWFWDFGDNTTSTQQNPTHTYASANTYIVKLVVTDDGGASDSTGQYIVAQPGPGGIFGDFTEVTPLDSLFYTPQDEDFWVITTAPADYDNDGDLDIAVLGYYVIYNQSAVEKLVLIRNDGEAAPDEWEFSYINVPLGNLSAGSSDLAWGDVDGDGDQDLAVGTNGETVIYRNDSGSLALTNTILPAYWEENSQADFDLRSITWADYDNDGDQDLLIPSVWDGTTYTFRTALMRNDGANGSGGWIFTEVDSVFAPTIHAQSAWADFDNDQDLDLLLVNISPLSNDGFIRRYRNDGGGVFIGEDILDSVTVEHGEAQWGDYDSDGDLDILIAGHIKENNGAYNVVLRIYRNDAETYVPIGITAGPGWWDLTAATWGDYDSDGDMDILLAGNYNSGNFIEGRARIYKNDGGIFTGDTSNTLPAPRASGDRGGTFSWLDIDGDMDLDYFIAGQYYVPGGNHTVEAQMHLYRNDGSGQNTAPTAPGGLMAATQPDSSILLSWLPASDDQTPSAALTYDIEIFRNGLPVSFPRRNPEPGNVSAVNQWYLRNLPNGQYNWTVRAVDNAYNGGPLAQGSFNVGTLSGIVDDLFLPGFYELSENFPNPFNPSTTFEFKLPEKSLVKMHVYNIQGRKVAEILNGYLEAGIHKLLWNAGNLSSGTYFVRFLANNFEQTQKVILLK